MNNNLFKKMAQKCGTCNGAITTKRPAIPCTGTCQRSHHIQCTNIPADLLTSVTNYPALSWKCENCFNKPLTWDPKYFESIFENKFKLLLKDISEKFNDLKNEIAHSAAKVVADINAENNSIDKTYSAALKTEAAIIIKPKDQEQKNLTTRADIFNNINPVKNNINISKVRNIKEGGILVGCSSSEDTLKLKEIAKDKLMENYNIKDVRNVKPRIRIVGMSEKLKKNELIQYIKFQNKHLNSENCDMKISKLWSTKKNFIIYQAIVQVETDFYDKVMSIGEGKLFVGYDLCSVYDSFEIRRCFKCSGFNHMSNQCRSAVCCPKCAGKHEVKNCTSTTLKCVNCINYSNTNKMKLNIEHTTWDRNCFVYKQHIDELKSKISSA